MDIIVPLLGRFMDVETAGRYFFLQVQLLSSLAPSRFELSVKRVMRSRDLRHY